jgi:hypothetical protein
MLAAHAFGASIVEALITGLGVAYFQKRHPEYLLSLRSVFAPGAVDEGQPSGRPLWQLVTFMAVIAVAVLGVLGMVIGGGDPGHFFGADWSKVGWPDVATMLLVTLVIAVVLVPIAYLVLPTRIKRVGATFSLIAVLAPLGLIAPGFAYGEGGAGDVQAAFGYVPKGLQDVSGIFSAPLSGYDVPLPFFNGANAPLWHAAIGYEIAGIIGILLIGIAVVVISRLLGVGGSPSVEQPSGGRA